jgi:hypothetical protein
LVRTAEDCLAEGRKTNARGNGGLQRIMNEIICLRCGEKFLVDINGGTCPYCECEYTVDVRFWDTDGSEIIK